MTIQLSKLKPRWAEYSVMGIPNSKEFPYHNGLKTLKEAVKIAKTYRDVYGDGSATHVIRHVCIRAEVDGGYSHSSGMSHRWRIFSDGRMERLMVSSHCPFERKTFGIHEWIYKIPKPPGITALIFNNRSLTTELSDLESICNNIDFTKASSFLGKLRKMSKEDKEILDKLLFRL